MGNPVRDEEVVVEMLVRITTYGKPERAAVDVEAATRHALRVAFGEGRITILTAPFGTHYDEFPLVDGA